jgi:hypothetical protein
MNVNTILPWYLLIFVFLIIIFSTFYVEGFQLTKDIKSKDPSGEYSMKLASAIDFAMADTTKQSFISIMPSNAANISGVDNKISGLLNPNQRLLTILGDSDTLRVLAEKSNGILNLSVADLPVMLMITSTGPIIYRDKMSMSSLLTNLTI